MVPGFHVVNLLLRLEIAQILLHSGLNRQVRETRLNECKNAIEDLIDRCQMLFYFNALDFGNHLIIMAVASDYEMTAALSYRNRGK